MRARGQLLDDAVQGGEPRGDQVREVTGTEEPFRAREQVVVVLVPAEALARAEALCDLRPASVPKKTVRWRA
jgi:hypothetical protein